jgi:hypothetical protein
MVGRGKREREVIENTNWKRGREMKPDDEINTDIPRAREVGR